MAEPADSNLKRLIQEAIREMLPEIVRAARGEDEDEKES